MPARRRVGSLSILCVQTIGNLYREACKCVCECSGCYRGGENTHTEGEKGSSSSGSGSSSGSSGSGREGEERERGDDVPHDKDRTQDTKEREEEFVESRRKRKIGLESFMVELSRALTSHSHVTLHHTLFTHVTSELDVIYNREKCTRQPIQNAIVLFVNASLRELDFGERKMFAESGMCQVLYNGLTSASGLQKLIIGRSLYWRSHIFESLHDKLQSLPNLTVLKIQFICTPEMISGLSRSCPRLTELSIRGSEKISDLDCEELAKCRNLVTLDISGTRITGKGCWKIVDSIKCLSWLQHCAFNCNSDSLLFESRSELFEYVRDHITSVGAAAGGGVGEGDPAAATPPPPPPPPQAELSLRDVSFGLKNFWLFNPMTNDFLTTFLCPDLEQLRLDFIFQDLQELPEVEVLSSLEKLNKLGIQFYDQCVYGLAKGMIEACGEALTCLSLHLADDWFVTAPVHNVVANCCPNLVNLFFSGDYKVRHTLEECDEQLDFSIPSPAHPRLLHLKVTGVVSDARLRFLLTHSPSLTSLHLDGELEWLHDSVFKVCLDEINPLPYLEEIWFNVSTTVTLATVRLLLKQTSPLRSIGRLCHMGGATMGEYQELLSLVKESNLDVKLIWVTDERVKK